MIRFFSGPLFAATLLASGAHQEPVRAQQLIPPVVEQAGEVALSLSVVVTKYQGEKKVSTVPYLLSVVANSGMVASVRMGSQVPIANQVGPPASQVMGYSYKDVGLNIDAGARSSTGGRFRLDLTVEDGSVVENAGTASGGHPVFRSFKASESILLRDGQSSEFTAATDKLSGEVTKVTVTLNVAK